MQHSTCTDGQCSMPSYGSYKTACKSQTCHDVYCPTKDFPKSPEEAFGHLMKLGMEAKKELMKDKMKAHLEAKEGTKMNQVAELAVDSLLGAWEQHMQGHMKKHEVVEKFKEMMMK